MTNRFAPRLFLAALALMIALLPAAPAHAYWGHGACPRVGRIVWLLRRRLPFIILIDGPRAYYPYYRAY